MNAIALPLPPHYDPDNVVNDTRWIDYQALQAAAIAWRRQHGLKTAATDKFKIGILVIDAQNTFCHPNGELYVAGADGLGAVRDSQRTVEFGYRNIGVLTGDEYTLDTHRSGAVFHPYFLVDDSGNHPAPFTTVTAKDIKEGRWKPNPYVASALGLPLTALYRHLEHYTETLESRGRYALTIWPYHGMLGDKGHALVSGLAEFAFFHSIARGVQPGIEVKGTHPLVENYSVLGPEVTQLFDKTAVPRNTRFIEKLLRYDALVIAGQAKSHCVAWTIDDLLSDIQEEDPALASKVYILGDCTTAIVAKAPDGTVLYDYNDDADKAFAKFQNAGMHLVNSIDPIENWPGIRL